MTWRSGQPLTLAQLSEKTKALSMQELLVRAIPPAKSEVNYLTAKMNIRMDPEMQHRLREVAIRRGQHTAELIRTFIEWGLEECQ
jgi:hypothetical protein